MTMRATHLRLLPPPPLTNMDMDHPVFDVVAMAAILERGRLATEDGDRAAASSARADLRAAMAAAREARAKPLDSVDPIRPEFTQSTLAPYRRRAPLADNPPVIIIIAANEAEFLAYVKQERLSPSRTVWYADAGLGWTAHDALRAQGREPLLIEVGSYTEGMAS